MANVQLDRLEVKKKTWGEHQGKLLATITIVDDSARYEVQLPPDFSDKVVELCKDELVKALKSSTDDFIDRIQTGLTLPALEGGAE